MINFSSPMPGFLYTGTLIHNRIIDFQYLAPLQGNFNPNLSNDSTVYFYRTGMPGVYTCVQSLDSRNSFEMNLCYIVAVH